MWTWALASRWARESVAVSQWGQAPQWAREPGSGRASLLDQAPRNMRQTPQGLARAARARQCVSSGHSPSSVARRSPRSAATLTKNANSHHPATGNSKQSASPASSLLGPIQDKARRNEGQPPSIMNIDDKVEGENHIQESFAAASSSIRPGAPARLSPTLFGHAVEVVPECGVVLPEPVPEFPGLLGRGPGPEAKPADRRISQRDQVDHHLGHFESH